MSGEIATGWIDEHSNYLTTISDKIWDYAEIGLAEVESADLLAGELQKNKFLVEKGIAGMPTAFKAVWGSGKPFIGFLAEYDALKNSSQKRASVHKEVAIEGGPGHGCGHNLLGTAHLGTVLALQKEMMEGNLSGTIVFYGCPAEETLLGKVFMARDGYFDDIDIFLTWHPETMNCVSEEIWQALMSVKFNFYGISAHAAQNPEMGRSAQDAVELMNVGVNYLREHIIDSARVHYAITKTSGQPNTVPDYAQVWYYVRGPHRSIAEDVFKRVTNVARGAALMTDTKMDVEYVVGTPEPLPNDVLCNLLHESMTSLPEIDWSKEDVAFAREIVKSLNQDAYKESLSAYHINGDDEKYLHCQLLPLRKDHPYLPNGSSDVSDASWIAPTGQIYTACGPLGIPLHSWQFTSVSSMGIGHKGMLYAAKAMAVAGIKLMKSPTLVKAAKDEFMERTGGKKFVSMTPKEVEISFDQ